MRRKSLKTFNIDSETYSKFAEYCKEEGISMSKKIDNFIASELKKLGLHLDIEKDLNASRDADNEETDEEHPLEKYC